MSQGKYWCLTLNNYEEENIRQWRSAVEDPSLSYICWQQEVAPTTGTPHLQGYVAFKSNKRLSALKKLLGGGLHAVRANGTPSQNRSYCSKEDASSVEGSFEEFGQIPEDPRRGARSDFQGFQEAVKEGLNCKRKAREQFPELVAKYPRWCYDTLADQKDLCVEEHTLHQWQSDLAETLQGPADDRKVIFVVDKDGGKGKTWFAKHYTKWHENAQFMEPAKKADMAYALQDDLKVLFLNVTRTTEEKNHDYLYSFVESVKDGMVFSPKYESRMKYYDKVHVVVMTNSEPNYDLLSSDRYDVIYLD